jgi:hypothetical protein
VFGAAIDKKM